jgi:hypothetical protein
MKNDAKQRHDRTPRLSSLVPESSPGRAIRLARSAFVIVLSFVIRSNGTLDSLQAPQYLRRGILLHVTNELSLLHLFR